MDIKEYISSGVLELYVLDQLPSSESRDVEANAMKYPEIKAEIDSIEQTLFAIASSTAKTPRAGLQAQIINAVLAADNVPSRPSNSSNASGKWFFSLAILGFALAGLLGWLLMQEKNTSEQLNNEFLAARDSCSQKDEMISRQVKMLENIFLESATIVPMAGTDSQPDAKANIVYNVENQTILLESNNLPAAPAGKQYQLWGIVAGTPVDLGVFDVSNGIDLISMKYSAEVQAFAVTLEPEGGSTVPTLELMYVIGNVSS